MKNCQKCNYQNNDAMNFCMQCGAPLPASHMSIDLDEAKTQSLHGAPPTNFGPHEEIETFDRKTNFGSNLNNTTTRPKSNGKIFLAIGGVAALLILGVGAVLAIAAYNIFTPVFVDPKTPTPTPRLVIPTPAVSPTLKPTATATPQTSFTPPTEPTKVGTFTVYANGGWQVSDIDIVELEHFTITTVGIIDIAGVKTQIPAKGFDDKNSIGRRLYPEYPTGALLFRTHYPDGHLGNVLPVAGGAFENFPDELGRLEFCVNDNAPKSNGGQFNVTVKMTSVPKAKK